jgi:diguanylate cyclase (GGDEF)-like protein
MDCKFLDSYRADLDGTPLEVWYCRRNEPLVLGQSKEIAQRACAGCRQSAHGRSPDELAAELERRNHELVALDSIAVVEPSLDTGTVLETGLDTVVGTLAADAGWIALAGDGCLDLACQRGLSRDYAEQIAHLRVEDAVGDLLGEADALAIDDLYAGPDTLAFARREGLESLLGTPLKIRDRLLGVLVVATRHPRTFTSDDLYFARAAGSQLAVAIERGRLYQDQLERTDRERRLLEAVENVNKSLGSHSVPLTVLVEAAQLMGSARSALLVARGDTLVAEDVYNMSDEFKRGFAIPLEESASGSAILRGETVAVADVDDDLLVDPYLVDLGGYRAFLTAPLQSYKGTYGALTVFYEEPRRFSDDDHRLLRTFANQAAIALENQRLMREKDHLARTDALTGVGNRGYFEMMLEQALRTVRRSGGEISLLFIDLDDLKTVNDHHGHQVGDRLLKELGDLLRHCCRDTDTVARYGGDEFVVLMPATDERGAHQVVTKIERALEEHDRVCDDGVPLSASLGSHTSGWVEPEELLLEADKRMYEMKRRRAGG